MSTRNSGFARVPADLYQTPAWVTDALLEHVNVAGRVIWEPACGEGKMVRALEAHGATVFATDLNDYGFPGMGMTINFLEAVSVHPSIDDIFSNPPYGVQGRTAEKFISKGLSHLQAGGVLALLLQADFDSAGGRRHLFRDCPDFAGRVVLNRRIEWFPRKIKADGKKEGGPSANHSWFIWQKRVLRPVAAPFVVYAPTVAL